MWTLLNKLENQDVVSKMLTVKEQAKTKLMNFMRNNENSTPLARKDYIELIAKHHLNQVLETYLNHQQSGDDLYHFTKTMIRYNYDEAIIKYVQTFYHQPTSWMSRLGTDRQKTMMLIVDTQNFDLIETFARHHLYTDMTEVVQKAIEYQLDQVISHLIGHYKQAIQFRKIAKTCIESKNLTLLEDIIYRLEQDDLNYLLSWGDENDLETILFLVLRGATFDEKHYNMKTFKKVNQFIQYLINHRGK